MSAASRQRVAAAAMVKGPPTGGAIPKPGRSGATVCGPEPLSLPHPRVQREGVDEQQSDGHRTAFALGPTNTDSDPGATSIVAGPGPTRSPSA